MGVITSWPILARASGMFRMLGEAGVEWEHDMNMKLAKYGFRSEKQLHYVINGTTGNAARLHCLAEPAAINGSMGSAVIVAWRTAHSHGYRLPES